MIFRRRESQRGRRAADDLAGAQVVARVGRQVARVSRGVLVVDLRDIGPRRCQNGFGSRRPARSSSWTKFHLLAIRRIFQNSIQILTRCWQIILKYQQKLKFSKCCQHLPNCVSEVRRAENEDEKGKY